MKTKTLILVTLSLCLSMSIQAQDPTQKMMQALMSNKADASKLQDTYLFQWEYKTIMKSSNDEINMNYLINSDRDYIGMQMSSDEHKQMDFMCIIVDIKAELMGTFMKRGDQKMLMLSETPKQGTKNENNPKYSYKEIGTKEILGFECYGIELQNADYNGTMYFTLDAPVSFSALFAFGKNNSTPKGFDPALLEVLEEDALIMEMNFTHKKKKKQSFTMTAISLEQKKTEIKPSKYQVMGF